MIGDQPYPVHIVARVNLESNRSVEFLVLSYKCRKEILYSRIYQLQGRDSMNELMKQIFKRLSNNGLSDISQEGEKQQMDKNTGPRHMAPDERSQKLLQQVI
ncbi:MAG: hypothetical protein U5K79_17275 [Cyclobacteriaceae bacterium]|nr:hypothetical protein [Cyclobacteriaceae bacterium]